MKDSSAPYRSEGRLTTQISERVKAICEGYNDELLVPFQLFTPKW